ncbi:MAG: FUN14 domain-containing protein [Candidatus Bathyarchaeia archaeon]
MSSSDILTPIAAEMSIGGIGGFVVGYALKKIAKLLVVLLGIGFLILEYFAYKGIISVDYSALTEWAKRFMGDASWIQAVVVEIVAHLPFGLTFFTGFLLGLKMG